MKRAVAFLLTCGLVLQSTAGNPVFVLAEPGNVDSPMTEADSSSLEENEETSQSAQDAAEADSAAGTAQEDQSEEIQSADSTQKTETEETIQVTEETGEAEGKENQLSGMQSVSEVQEQGVSDTEITENLEELPETVETQEGENTEEKIVAGSISIRMISALGVNRTHNFHISLTKEGYDGFSRDLELKAQTENEAASEEEITVSDLQDGTYVLEITGNGFAAYTQTLEVSGDHSKITVYTDEISGFDYTAKAHPGVIRYGDVTGDGKIDDGDSSRLIDTMENEAQDVNCDLNGDGEVDIADMQYSAQAMNQGSILSAVEKSIAPESAEAEVSSGTLVSGSMEALLKNSQSVQVKPVSGMAISDENPIQVDFAFDQENGVAMDGLTIQSPAGTDGEITAGEFEIEYVDDNGETQVLYATLENGASRARSGGATVTKEQDGTLVVNFNGQIAVKKVTFKITQTSGNSLAEISKVEFLNDMENRIPAPEMNIPEGIQAEAGNKEFTVSWKAEQNITGYEVMITQKDQPDRTEVQKTSETSLNVKSFGGQKLKNGTVYLVKVQSVNGQWKSGYGETIEVTPVTDEIPAPPDNVKAQGGYQKITVSWKQMEDTDSYNIYYKEKGTDTYTKIENITGTSYRIENLKDQTGYLIYVTGVNELGESAPSLEVSADTVSVQPAKLPNYKLLNTSNGEGVLSSHIKSVTIDPGRASMKNSPLDAEKNNTGLGVVDKNNESYYQVNDWDDGATYPKTGLIFEFDASYQMDTITFTEPEDFASFKAAVLYKNEKGSMQEIGCTVSQKSSDNGRKYYVIKLNQPVTTDKIQIRLGHFYGFQNKITVSEVNFYYYDSLEDDIEALFADDLFTTLREDVTSKTLEELQLRLDTPDEVSGEYHPDRAQLQKELDNAKAILNEQNLSDSITISNAITAKKDSHLGFASGLNAWQPLGVTAHAGETVVIYVGSKNQKVGSTTNLQVVATQVHAESDAMSQTVATLKVGRNEITVPSIQSTNVEKGGNLYIQYTGNSSSDAYAVRVSGGTDIPVLNLYGIDDEGQAKEAVTAYVAELETYVAGLEEKHHAHQGSDSSVDYDYDEQNCILNTTDLQLDQMMYTLPASQVLAGLGSGTTEERAERLYRSMVATDQMMTLFYQHKGLSNASDAGAKDRMPSQHLNIRYMRMFAGAFMYAGGNHIGIEWGSTTGLTQGVPIVSEEGKYISGEWFGWGIAHEIGHNINQAVYAQAEVTNNYFAQLAQSDNSNSSVRFSYTEVYDKVTSGTTGQSSNVFTQLAMYWQLHLAYDRDYNYKTYDTWKEQFDSLFYARVDSYARDTSRAPKPGGISLTLSGDSNQKFMRLACAAAEKDLTDFFVRWGMVPDETTKAYASQFEKEERAIYYVNDDAQTYEIENGTAGTIYGQDVVGEDTTAAVSEGNSSQIVLNLTNTAENPDVVHGYEIVRVMTENGVKTREVAGFTTESTFTDTVSSINNRVITYEVTVIDKFMNRSQSKELDPIKIATDGSQVKDNWTLTTNMISEADTEHPADEQDPCAPEAKPASVAMIDNDDQNVYTGTSEKDPEIVLQFHESVEVTALKYTLKGEGTPIRDYEIQISGDGQNWTSVGQGTFDLTDGVDTVYFSEESDGAFMSTYDASYLKLVARGQAGTAISVSELDVLGPTGDNIEFRQADDDTYAIGYLSESYEYAEGQSIPEGSLVFAGSYKGNSAYNVVAVYDGDGKIVGGTDEEGTLTANQILLSDVPEEGDLGDTYDGTWIYWIEPSEDGTIHTEDIPEEVRAELYRVNNAQTNEGQRMVSDTLIVHLPDDLPSITLGSQK